MELLIERVLGERYHIRSLLGRQTGRRTFLAQDLQTEQLVVLKLLLFDPDFTWDDLKLFEREAAVLKSIGRLSQNTSIALMSIPNWVEALCWYKPILKPNLYRTGSMLGALLAKMS